MTNIINFSAVSAITVLSVLLALLIELALLRVLFGCLAHVKAVAAEWESDVVPGRRWVKQSVVNDLRNAGM
jgi:hypothetical protein